MRGMADVVYLHVGAPKTGTTYLQDRLSVNRTRLARHGVHYPVGQQEDMFGAALDLIERPWGGLLDEVRGEWAALARRVRRTRGTVVISHEILAAASRSQIERAMADLAPAEVHVVLTARDVARQVPAEWQEHVKHRRRVSYARFVRRLRTSDARKGDKWFWEVQSLPEVLGRWSAGLAPERVHLVTVPQPGAAPDELWLRFCRVLGIDPAWAPRDSERRNPSIGTAEATLVRRLNRRLQEAEYDHADYRSLVRELVVHQTLADRPDMDRITLPPDAWDWADEIAESWLDWVTGAGIDVVGDLDELRPRRPEEGEPWHDPDRPRPSDVADAALDALVAVLTETARRPDPDEQVSQKVARLARRVRLP